MEATQFMELLQEALGTQAVSSIDTAATPQALLVPVEQLVPVCQVLFNHENCFFDQLACITALDNGPEANTIEVAYNLNSIALGHSLMLKVSLPRQGQGPQGLPQVPTVSHIWGTANWHEREAFDLVGVYFEGHPDLRRILLPADWQGHPLRKDYQNMDYYQGIKVEY